MSEKHKKSKGKVSKLLIVVCLAMALSIRTQASVVSDNDGSSFISKAEYDSLKKEFQNSLNVYNSSIDDTIDNAIAAYIAGAKNSKEITMSCLIDNKGVYGSKMKLSWNSSPSFRMIGTEWPKCVQRHKLFVAIGILQFDPTSYKLLDTASFEGGIYDYGLLDGEGNQVTNNDYGTKKEYRVENVKIETTNYRMLRYVKTVNYLEMNQFYGFPNDQGSSSHGATFQYNTGNILELNINNMNQKNLVRGQQVDYHRYGRQTTRLDYYNNLLSWVSVLKTGNVMISQDYTEEKEHVYAPFSTTQEYVWDPDSNVPLAWENQFQTVDTYATGDLWWTGDTSIPVSRSTEPSRQWTPRKLYFPWQYLLFKSGARNESGSDVQAKDAIIYNYYTIDNRNRAQKNGLVLGTTPSQDNAEVSCKCLADVDGVVYFYVGKDPIDNWTSASFTGVKYNLTADGKEVDCSFGRCSSGENIWVLFAPNDPSENGILKVNKLYYTSN